MGCPLVIPTQLALEPEDVATLAHLGFDGIMIGAIVTGKDAATVEAVCARFRAACDEVRQ